MSDPTEQICRLIEATFQLPEGSVGPEDRQSDTMGWDSVGHLNLMLALEQRFSIRAEFEEMIEIDGVPALVRLVRAKRPDAP